MNWVFIFIPLRPQEAESTGSFRLEVSAPATVPGHGELSLPEVLSSHWKFGVLTILRVILAFPFIKLKRCLSSRRQQQIVTSLVSLQSTARRGKAVSLISPRPSPLCPSLHPVLRYKKEILYFEGGKTVEQVAQRGCGCPLPGSIQSQIGWGFEQLGLMEGSCSGRFLPMAGVLERDESLRSLPIQTVLWFYDSFSKILPTLI